MIPKFDQVHPKFQLNGKNYDKFNLLKLSNELLDSSKTYEQEIGEFFKQWLSSNSFITVNTSGSTGKPKAITLKKEAMVNSAVMTGSYFNLKAEDRALLCLPAQYIAGKMMLVRALVLGLILDIIEPSSKPKIVRNIPYQFCAMTPMQVENTLNDLNIVETLIVGGATVSINLKDKLQHLGTNVYETYGMTETVTHIAVRKLNGNKSQPYFNVLPDVEIAKNSNNCLVIDAPHLSADIIVTNDIIRLHSPTSFELLGRSDNVINSGGIKLSPESIEQKLSGKINQPFFISALQDDQLGEKLIIIIEGTGNIDSPIDFTDLDRFEKPKELHYLNNFIRTKSGKINRSETLKLLR